MALIIQSPTTTEAERRAAKLLEQLDDDEFQDAFFADLEQRVASFEQQYGLRSEDVGQAINAGVLVESHDVCQWLLDYKLLLRLGAR
jgi:hypothetical protein